MKRWTVVGVATTAVVACSLAWMISSYLRDIGAARRRTSAGSGMAATKCGPIEYAERGAGPPVLVVHGAGGGFDQGLLIADPRWAGGFRAIAMSRFGYLRTPLPADASAETQADAHACLLDALGVGRAAVIGVSAGAPSATQFCLRYADRCAALVLLVPMAYSDKPFHPLEPRAQALLDRLTGSDFIFWGARHLLQTAVVESVLGTPIEDVRAASKEEQGRALGMLALLEPLSLRAKGLRNEAAVARKLGPWPLERIAAPTLIASVEDDRFATWAGARYAAERIPGARFVGFQRGGHLWVGHGEEMAGEVRRFLEQSVMGVQ